MGNGNPLKGGEVVKVNVNLLPAEYRPKRWVLPAAVALAAAVAAAGYFGPYSYLQKNAAAQDEVAVLQAQLDSIEAETMQVIASMEESPIGSLKEQITAAEAQKAALGAMEQDYEKNNAGRIYWLPVLQAIGEWAPTDMIFEKFRQVGGEITIEGTLGGDDQNTIVIVEYLEDLEKLVMFSSTGYEISTEEVLGDDGKTREVFRFVITLEVVAGGQ
jgi:Tfp pilus assembly protein PilN